MFPKKAVSLTIPYQDETQFQSLSPDPGLAEQLYQEWLAKTKSLKTQAFCSCVDFAKRLTGYVGSVGKAKNWPLNAKNATVGGVVVLNEGNVGHVAYITATDEDSFTVSESNYIPCAKSSRTIKNDDSTIIGFWTNN